MRDRSYAWGCALFAGGLCLTLFVITSGGSRPPNREGVLTLVLLGLVILLGYVMFGPSGARGSVWKCLLCGQSNEEELTACEGCGKDRA